MIEHKIIFAGSTGAGKTTAIQAVSEVACINTDVVNTDKSVHKEKTTVALDYGEVSLGENERLRLYGTPGQSRFSFIWKVLSEGALGIVILVDLTSPNPQEDLALYVTHFRDLIQRSACVIALTKAEHPADEDFDRLNTVMKRFDIICPIVAADPRDPQQVTGLIDLLLLQLEN